jgi:hypothetical protein
MFQKNCISLGARMISNSEINSQCPKELYILGGAYDQFFRGTGVLPPYWPYWDFSDQSYSLYKIPYNIPNVWWDILPPYEKEYNSSTMS